jgi:AraC family transcriptional regulator of adaptative response/methylated-DNA-[protein]-cysteine methyltransferase
MDATIDSDTAWAAFAARDRAYDGRFVVAVRSTHIYCKPSCAARRPRRDNVRFLADAAAAQAAGYRACRRCLPDSVARDRAAVVHAAGLLARAAAPPSLAALAAAAGYATHHFHRLFRRLTGVTPAALARTHRADRALDALRASDSVTAAIYDAGYAAPSRFYVDAARWGMAPHAVASGGAGEAIRWTVAPTPLGTLLLAATPRGWCRFAFEDGEAGLRAAFPAAELHRGDAAFDAQAAALLAIAAATDTDTSLPVPLRRLALRTLLHDAAIG